MRFAVLGLRLGLLVAASHTRASATPLPGVSLGAGLCADHIATDETDVWFIGAPQGEAWRIQHVPKNGGGPRRTLNQGCDYGPIVVDKRYVYCLYPEHQPRIPEGPKRHDVVRIDKVFRRRSILATVGDGMLFDAGEIVVGMEFDRFASFVSSPAT